MIPIIIICYNNHIYVENTIKQIKNINEKLLKQVFIMDNNSNDEETINYLKRTEVDVHFNKKNEGPWIDAKKNSHLFHKLPNKFVITDPDLGFNENLPVNFLEIISDLGDKYNCSKIGFALYIGDYKDMYSDFFYNIEKEYWKKKIKDPHFELYDAPIDTTFCMINKKGGTKNIRIAGNFTARHYPWYKEEPLLSIYDKYKIYNKQTNFSTITKIVLPYISSKFIKIKKRDEIFFIEKDDSEINFWNNYENWNKNLFDIIDKEYKKGKCLIVIGDKNGCYSMYGSRKFVDVLVCSDSKKLKRNIEINCRNVKIIDQNINLNFIDIFKINFDNVTLVIVNEYEEDLLEYLFMINKKYGVSVYIKFNYHLWKDKNIERYGFLSKDEIEIIRNNSNLYLEYKP